MNTPVATAPSRPALGEVVQLPGGSVRVQGHLELVAEPLGGGVTGIRPVRLPRSAREHFPRKGYTLAAITDNAAGVRLVFETDATSVRLRTRTTQLFFEELPGPRNAYVARIDGADAAQALAPVDAVLRLTFAGDAAETRVVQPSSVVILGDLPSGSKTVTVWLPQGMIIDLIDVEADAPIVAATPPALPVWVHHGSSISHCVETPVPTGAWPVVAADLAGLDVINLGFGGQCMLDPFVADAIARTPADVISIKVGVNIVGARAMDQRTFGPALHGFLDRIRVGHPDTPVVLASSIFWPGSEDTPGPADVEFLPDGGVRCFTAGDLADVARGALTLSESRELVEDVVRRRAASGEAIFYVDGHTLYGPADTAEFVLPDSLHPDATLYAEMGRRFHAAVFAEGGLVPSSSLGAAD